MVRPVVVRLCVVVPLRRARRRIRRIAVVEWLLHQPRIYRRVDFARVQGQRTAVPRHRVGVAVGRRRALAGLREAGAAGRHEPDTVAARRQARELVPARIAGRRVVRRHRRDGRAGAVQHRVPAAVQQVDRHPVMSRLAAVLHAVAVRVIPHQVAQARQRIVLHLAALRQPGRTLAALAARAVKRKRL